MSSPSPDPSKVDHHYPSSETSDHVLLTHAHTCTCCRECAEKLEPPKTEQHIHHPHCHTTTTNTTINHTNPVANSCNNPISNAPATISASTKSLANIHHPHHLINLSHPPHHVHPSHRHVLPAPASPKTHHETQQGNTKIMTPCTCHIKTDTDIEDPSSPIILNEQSNQVRKMDEDRIEVSPLPPALPPRPPPRPRYDRSSSLGSRCRSRISTSSNVGVRKYVFWCCACGGLATILGAMFLAVYFLLRSYTSTLGYFETIPTFVPASMLILTGICVISLARRKNRYSYLIKICGICCLVCALTCVLVTITTTVIHMNRLQTLRECVYTQKTRTCTCYSVLLEAQVNTADDGVRFIFDSTPDCEVIHGALYTCLRAMFGLSVTGILVCIFSCMLVYQLLSHEKKKMYWEQLELRCRSFYQQQTIPSSSSHGSLRGGPPVPSTTYCSCCEECRYPQATPATVPQAYAWDTHHAADRFWATGRVGNFYSPNPEDGPAANPDNNRSRPGWNWRRLPWSRGNTDQNETARDNSLTYQAAASSADSQYGFSNRSGGENAAQSDQISGSTGSYSMLDNRPPLGGVYVWGPPPPYSNPNSPARRYIQQSPARYHHLHHHPHGHESHCQMNENNQQYRSSRRTRYHANTSNKDNYENTTEPEIHHHHHHHQMTNENGESTDTSSCMERVSHTLPVRKIKKRSGNDLASVKSINQPIINHRTNVQNIFSQNNQDHQHHHDEHQIEHDYHEPNVHTDTSSASTIAAGAAAATAPTNVKTGQTAEGQQCRFLPRLHGVENAAFQKQENSPVKPNETTESEVYFADVSSCCHSIRNDSSLYDEAIESSSNQKSGRLISLQRPVESTIKDQETVMPQEDQSNVADGDEYLMQRIAQRQMSTRSRLPFPIPNSDDLTEFKSDSCLQLLPKDISQNSLCSNNAQTPMTETTDDAITPDECCTSGMGNTYMTEKSCEQIHHRGPYHATNNMDQFLAPDAQYEIIPEKVDSHQFRNIAVSNANNSSNLTNTISSVNYDQNYYNHQTKQGYNFGTSHNVLVAPPKTLNLNQQSSSAAANRRNIGSNISALIQNLNGGNPAGLLYGDANVEEEIQGQACHSDGTMDSGWQSGSEKTAIIDNNTNNARNIIGGNNASSNKQDDNSQRSVNV